MEPEPGRHREWKSSKGTWEQRGRTALGSVLCQENLHHHQSRPHSTSWQAQEPRSHGIKLQGRLRRTPALPQEGIPRIHAPRHAQRRAVDSTQVEAAIDAGSEGMCCLLLAVTAGFPISSDACSLAGEAGAARQLDPKKPSLLLYYLAQSVITVLGNCITFRSVLCIVYYRENSAF